MVQYRRSPRFFTPWRRLSLGIATILLVVWLGWASHTPAVGSSVGAQTQGKARQSIRNHHLDLDSSDHISDSEALAKWAKLTNVIGAGVLRSEGGGAAAAVQPLRVEEDSVEAAELPAEDSKWAVETQNAEEDSSEAALLPNGEDSTEGAVTVPAVEEGEEAGAALGLAEEPRSLRPSVNSGDATQRSGSREGSSSSTKIGTVGRPRIFADDGRRSAAAAVLDRSLRCPPLTEDLLRQRAKANTVMLGVMNSAQQDFGMNWLRHLEHVGITYYVVGAADSNTSALLANMQVPCFDYAEEAKSELGLDPSLPFSWGQDGWRRMTWQKVFALDRVVDWGFNVVVSDMDVAWMRDPLPLFEEHPHADVMFSTDGCSTANEVGDDGLEMHGHMHHNFNTGVYLLRNTPNSRAYVHAWRALFDSGYGGHDQEGAYQLTRVGTVEEHESDSRVSKAWNDSMYMAVLPSHVFSNGHTYMVQKLHEKMLSNPYEVHLTWTYNGMGGKRARMRDGMLWYDAEEYYSGPSFVTVDLTVPETPEGFNSWQENEDMISFHLSAIHGQLYQAYIGMALATASRRAFISPKFQCFCEKIWYAVVHCRVVDAQGLQFPIMCPTDYIFQPDNFADDPAQFGTPLDFREPSFLDNPRTPQTVKDSVLEIRPSLSLQCKDCVQEEGPGPDGAMVLLVPPNLRDRELMPLLQPYTKYRIWRLSFEGVRKPSQAFAGFTCSGEAQEFDKRMEHITTEWCCRREEEAKKHGMQDRLKEQLRMSPKLYSSEPGLDTSC